MRRRTTYLIMLRLNRLDVVSPRRVRPSVGTSVVFFSTFRRAIQQNGRPTMTAAAAGGTARGAYFLTGFQVALKERKKEEEDSHARNGATAERRYKEEEKKRKGTYRYLSCCCCCLEYKRRQLLLHSFLIWHYESKFRMALFAVSHLNRI